MTPDLSQRRTGKGHKLQQGKFQLDVRKKFFTMRAVKHWKRDQSSCGLSITGAIQKSTRQGSKPKFGVSPASRHDLHYHSPPMWKGSLEGSSANSCSNQGQPEEPCPVWVCIPPRTEVPQPLWALILVFDNPHNKHFFPWIYSEFPICPLPLVLPLRTLRRICLHFLYTLPVSSCRPAVRSLLRAEDTQSPQPLLLHGTLQLPTPIALLDVLQYVNALLILQDCSLTKAKQRVDSLPLNPAGYTC